jgi:hypothetical protein
MVVERDRHRSAMPIMDEAIRERAYHLWIADGQPDGNAGVYWLSAQREILTTSLEGSIETAATAHMDSVSATTKPVWRRSPDREKANLALHNGQIGPASSVATVASYASVAGGR